MVTLVIPCNHVLDAAGKKGKDKGHHYFDKSFVRLHARHDLKDPTQKGWTC